MVVEGIRFYVGRYNLSRSELEVYVGGTQVRTSMIQSRHYVDEGRNFTVLLFPPHRVGAQASVKIVRRGGNIKLCQLSLLGSPGLTLSSARAKGAEAVSYSRRFYGSDGEPAPAPSHAKASGDN